MADQRFSLKWNNYQSHLITAFESLLGESDFVDVTLGVEGRRLSAHKMLLSACSPYFRELLKGNPCQHPIIVLRDIKYDDLHSLLQFMYNGEVNVAQDQLNSFLKSAESLKIRGLTDNTDDTAADSEAANNIAADATGSTVGRRRRRSNSSSAAAAATTALPPPVKKKRPHHDDVSSGGPVSKRQTSSHPLSSQSPSAQSSKVSQPVKQEVIELTEDENYEDAAAADEAAAAAATAGDAALGYDDDGGGGGVMQQYDESGGYDEDNALVAQDGLDHTQDGQGRQQLAGGRVADWQGGGGSWDLEKGGGGWLGDLYTPSGGEDANPSSKPTWYCEMCNKTFSNGGAWYNHKKYHTGETVCKVCSKIMGTVSSLNRHIKNEHASYIQT